MNAFTKDYYLNGPDSGLSNYRDYRWMPEQTIRFCERMMNYLGAKRGDSVYEVGCARGFYVKALRILGYNACGHDISEWAIENCDPAVTNWVSTSPRTGGFDWVLSKDCLEHVPHGQLADVVDGILSPMMKGGLIIVPLIDAITGEYINPADQMDSTHVIAWTLTMWLDYFQKAIDEGFHPFTVTGGYKLPGVKVAAEPFPHSTGFITLRRFDP